MDLKHRTLIYHSLLQTTGIIIEHNYLVLVVISFPNIFILASWIMLVQITQEMTRMVEEAQ